ncbi:transcription factor PHYTOCHROME INTERACTING FACTOR-LIKE 15-like isoform X2 [Hibiscus syriacus]|nr:transcription factor PHYTOCHROME INTERACTING FACTOR-LIKE 15-like isoform X2 [Hibiscus syriacus]
MELVWENGEVLIRGSWSKITKTTSPFSSHYLSRSKSRIQLIEGKTCTASGSKDGVADSTLAEPISGLSSAVLGSDKRCYHKQSDLPKLIADHQVHGSSLKQQHETWHMGSKEEKDKVNFSMFLSSGTTRAISSQGLAAGAEDLRGNNVKSLPPSGDPLENEGNLMAKKMKSPQKVSHPDEQSEAVPNTRLPNEVHESSTLAPDNTGFKGNPEQMVASSSLCSRGASNCPTYPLKRRYEDTDLSSNTDMEEEPEVTRGSKGAKGKRKTEVHNLSERERRDKINKKMRELKDLIPNCTMVDKASMLDEAIEYLKTLQLQVQVMSMGNGIYMPPMMFPSPWTMQHINAQHLGGYSPMAVGMGMRLQMGVGCGATPQFSTSLMPGTAPITGIPEATLNMLGLRRSSFVSSAGSFIPQSVQSQSAATRVTQVDHIPGGSNPTH